MAESQGPFSYTAETADQIVVALSSKRYAPYLKRAGYKTELAFQLYLYNARLSKAFLFPLHIVEIVLRNAIDEILTANFTDRWPGHATFHAILTEESRKSLEKAVSRATMSAGWKKDDVVAHLTFDFWSNLFRPEYDRPIWQANMQRLLPNANKPNRAAFQPLVAGINHFRNRIAHHEPILKENVAQKLKDITDVVGYRSKISADWLRNHSTVFQVVKTSPAMDGSDAIGPTLGDRCDTKFDLIEEASTLSQCDIKNVCAIVCHKQGEITGVIDASDIGRYVLEKRDETGLIDLNEHSVEDVIGWVGAKKSYVDLDASTGLDRLAEQIRTTSIRFALVNDSDQQLLGVIRKAHRKY